jgi:hypothetical protein
MTMTDTNKKRTGRSPSGDKTKKIISLTIDPALVAKIDEYAAEKKISRSAAIETAITGLFAVNATTSLPMIENSLMQSDDCIFASPQLGGAILY